MDFNKICEDFGVEFVDGNSKERLSIQQQILNGIDREIIELGTRNTTTLKKLEKKIEGENQLVNESRFWKVDLSDNKNCYVTIRFKGKVIFHKPSKNKDGDVISKPQWIKCENSLSSVKDSILKLKKLVEQLDSSDPIFTQFKK